MKEIQLTKGMVALVDDEDYEFLNQWKWCVSGYNGTTFYARRAEYNIETKIVKPIYMHRVVAGVTERKVIIDHIDRDGLNNQRSNLRICSQAQNRLNVIGHQSSTSNYKGVHFDTQRNKWVARISKDRTQVWIGRFDSEDEAAIEYNKHAIKLHGEFARLNIIEPLVISKT